jgi:hypothetical protein
VAIRKTPEVRTPEPATSGPRIRLLACGQCKTIENLGGLYEGPRDRADEYDVVLNLATAKHKDGVERIPHAPAVLVDVAQADWDNPEAREQIEVQIRASFDPNAETGLGSEAYAMKANFQDDAMACWAAHNRNPTCPDYKSDSKRLVPNTAAERKEAGLEKFDPNNPHTQRFLCEYCPVQSIVDQMKRKKAGAYDH